MAHKELDIGHLFLAGVITAAGAGVFWWITSQFKKTKEEDEHDDLDDMILASEASMIE